MADEMVKVNMESATARYLALGVDDGTTEDADNRFEIRANGKLEWGDGTNAQDLTLERGTGGVLLVNGNAVSPSVATLAVSTTLVAATHANRTLVLTGTGAALTQKLPPATGSGARYEFIVGAVNTSNHVINVTTTDVMYGNVWTNSTGDSPDLGQPWPTAADSDTVTLNGTTTGGQAVGDRLVFVDFATAKWSVLGHTTTSGTEATPFSAAVS